MVMLLSFAAQSYARELKQATCPADISKALAAKAQTLAKSPAVAASCAPSELPALCTDCYKAVGSFL